MSCSLGSGIEQRISIKVNRGGDCKLDVSGRAKADGCNDVYKYGVVGAFPSWSVALFPASHDGLVDLFRPCCIGAFHTTEFFYWQDHQQAAGIFRRCTVMRSEAT